MNRFRSLVFLSVVILFGAWNVSCRSFFLWMIKPGKSYADYKVPAAPDYSKPEAWAALPTKSDDPDAVPSNTGFQDQQKEAKADVFFVHPTTYLKSDGWNAPYTAPTVIYGLSPLKVQTSVFNGAARIYAPRYRQATLYSFLDKENGEKALQLASEDVLRAFETYLKVYNQGRPFFLAGHSQGSLMLISVIQKYLDERPHPGFVAAYLPGWGIETKFFKNVQPCRSAVQTGCFVSWNSKKWGVPLSEFSLKPERYEGGVCVNPITWTMDENEVPATAHKGAVGISFDHVDKNYVKARCVKEMLWVDLPANLNYESRRGDKRNYHIADYQLFYADIRENLVLRLQNHFGGK